jgi:hypothetical protein
VVRLTAQPPVHSVRFYKTCIEYRIFEGEPDASQEVSDDDIVHQGNSVLIRRAGAWVIATFDRPSGYAHSEHKLCCTKRRGSGCAILTHENSCGDLLDLLARLARASRVDTVLWGITLLSCMVPLR